MTFSLNEICYNLQKAPFSALCPALCPEWSVCYVLRQQTLLESAPS